jgi:hypothetical protein
MRRIQRPAILGFTIGAMIPAAWGFAALLAFGTPEGRAAEFFWAAVYATCPFWRLETDSYLLVPALNGVLYAALAILLTAMLQWRTRRSAPQ